MEDRERPGPAKKVVVRRVVRPADDPSAGGRTRALPRPRLPRRSAREEPAAPRTRLRDRAARLARHGVAATRLGLELAAGEARSLRWPSLSPLRAAVLTGAGGGLLAALLGALVTWGVSSVRGVAGGAGGVGLLLVLALVSLTVVASSSVAHRLGSPRHRTVPALGTVMTATLVLAFFLGPVGSPWAFLLLPALGAVCFGLADRLLATATDASGEDAA